MRKQSIPGPQCSVIIIIFTTCVTRIQVYCLLFVLCAKKKKLFEKLRPGIEARAICLRKRKEPYLTVLRLKATAETRKLLSNKMAKPQRVHGRGLDTFYPRRACNSMRDVSNGQRLYQGSS